MDIEFDQILLDAIKLAHEAGKIHLACFRSSNLDVATKEGNDFDVVTKADKASEAAVVQGIRQLYPTHAILTEESGNEGGGVDSPWQWVIDPVDGTTNYSAGLPFFNISIGVRYRGETVVGVVYAAQLNELFTAVKGEGAFLNGEPIACSACSQLSHAVVSTGFPYDKATTADNNLDNVARVMPRVRGLRRLGAAALDMCYVAAGYLDGYWELNLHDWDVCAASLIASEAGAVVKPFRPNRGISLMVASPGIETQLSELVK